MSVFDPDPLIFGAGLVLFAFIRYTAVPPLDHVADVDLIGQHVGDGRIFPQRSCFSRGRLVPQSFLALILGGIGDPILIQNSGDGRFSVSL